MPMPDTAVMNGIGQSACQDPAVKCNKAAAKPLCSYARLVAKKGGSCTSPTVRLRIISMSSYAAFNISVDGHIMRVVATDANPVVEVAVGWVGRWAGRRAGGWEALC